MNNSGVLCHSSGRVRRRIWSYFKSDVSTGCAASAPLLAYSLCGVAGMLCRSSSRCTKILHDTGAARHEMSGNAETGQACCKKVYFRVQMRMLTSAISTPADAHVTNHSGCEAFEGELGGDRCLCAQYNKIRHAGRHARTTPNDEIAQRKSFCGPNAQTKAIFFAVTATYRKHKQSWASTPSPRAYGWANNYSNPRKVRCSSDVRPLYRRRTQRRESVL